MSQPWREAGRTELTTRVVEERLDAYVTALMAAPAEATRRWFAGLVPGRLNLAHDGTAEQQLELTLGGVLVYMRSGLTARAVAGGGWNGAAVLAQSLPPAVAGRRPLLIGPTTVAAMVRLAGVPDIGAVFVPSRADGAVPGLLRVQIGPVT